MRKAILYYLFSSISLLGDSIFLYFLSLNLLNLNHGGILSGIVLGIDSFFQIFMGPFLARFVDAMPQLKRRISNAFWMQALLILLALIPAFLNAQNVNSFLLLIVFFAFMRFLSLIDTQLKVMLPLYFEQQQIFPLVRSLSFSNFSMRCIHVISSSIAPLLIGISWLSVCFLNSFSYVFGLIGILLVLKIIKENQEVQKEIPSDKKNTEQITEYEKSKWSTWNNQFLFFNNLAFSSIALILSKEMLLAKSDTFFNQVLLGPAPLYIGFFIALVLMIVFPHTIKKFVKNARLICSLVFILACSLVLSAILHALLHAIILLISGICYGITLIGSGAFIQPKLQGAKYIKSMANCQAFGKIGTLISLFAAGLCIDHGFSPQQLLILFGCTGALTSLYLLVQGVKLERKPKETLINTAQ